MLPQGSAEVLRFPHGLSLAAGREADREFLPSHPAGNTVIPVHIHNLPGQLHQRLITGQMSICIINQLEIVDIE
ncbi:hypothetical protein D3C75_1263320 [compost metagenome]